MQNEEPLKEYRCECGKLLFKGKLVECVVEIKCRKCRALARWSEKPDVRSRALKP